MTFNQIDRGGLTASELAVLADIRERWKRMGSGAHLDDWLALGPGLMILRRLAMRAAFVNRPKGRRYAEAFAALLKRDGLGGINKTSISCVLWLHDSPERLSILREIRDAMSVGERARLNSPISAHQRVGKVLKARASGTEANQRTSPVALLKQQLAERDREIAQLNAKLAASRERHRSLFDLRNDTPADIGKAVVGKVPDSKALKIADAIKAAVKLKGRKPVG
jgi:hypothetical protein